MSVIYGGVFSCVCASVCVCLHVSICVVCVQKCVCLLLHVSICMGVCIHVCVMRVQQQCARFFEGILASRGEVLQFTYKYLLSVLIALLHIPYLLRRMLDFFVRCIFVAPLRLCVVLFAPVVFYLFILWRAGKGWSSLVFFPLESLFERVPGTCRVIFSAHSRSTAAKINRDVLVRL